MTSGCGRKGKDLWNSFSRTSRRLICNVTFKLPNGEKKTVQGKEGESVLQVAHRNEIPLEGMNANLSRVDISRCRCLWRISRLRYLSHSPRPKDVRQASRAKWGRRRPFGFRSWIDWDVWVLSKKNQKNRSRLGCQVIIPNDIDNLEVCLLFWGWLFICCLDHSSNALQELLRWWSCP